MRRITLGFKGIADSGIVEIGYDFLSQRVFLAEVVDTDDLPIQMRVNHEVLEIAEYPELKELINNNFSWNIQAAEALAIGYLNRQSEARVKLAEV